MKAKRVIRIELSEEDARSLRDAVIEIEQAVKGEPFEVGSFWYSNPVLEELSNALQKIK